MNRTFPTPRPKRQLSERAAPVFAAFGDSTRLHVVSRLPGEGPLSIMQLTEGSEVTRQAVTKHLGVLSSAGLVYDFRQGRERVWEVKAQQLEEARRALDSISKRWDEALERLRVMVEE